MLAKITKQFENVFTILKNRRHLNEKNIKDGIRQIKLLLLEADVNYKVVKDLVLLIKKEALGQKILKDICPSEQFIKIVRDKLLEVMGDKVEKLNLNSENISVILIVGLQGSGKTTTCAKIANYLKENHQVLLVGADVYRLAAKEQLKVLSKQCEVDFFSGDDNDNVFNICKKALKYAQKQKYNVLIIDSAGRLQINDHLMKELSKIKKLFKPSDILFVSDIMAGQNLVEVIDQFNKIIGINGIILTKSDSDSLGGVAISIRHITGKAIKFLGTGEKINDLEVFYPDRFVNRILGRGDILSLVEKVEKVIDKEYSISLEKKIEKNSFTLNDFLIQLQQIKKLGPLQSIMNMLAFKEKQNINQKQLFFFEAILLSMTFKERENYKIINNTRQQRIAKGSGTDLIKVNKLLKHFEQMKKIIKNLNKNPKFIQKFMS